jgi:hypothetical protein
VTEGQSDKNMKDIFFYWTAVTEGPQGLDIFGRLRFRLDIFGRPRFHLYLFGRLRFRLDIFGRPRFHLSFRPPTLQIRTRHVYWDWWS